MRVILYRVPPTTVLRDVFSLSQDYIIIKKLASVFSHCYGCAVVPPIPFMDITLSTQLGKTVEIHIVGVMNIKMALIVCCTSWHLKNST